MLGVFYLFNGHKSVLPIQGVKISKVPHRWENEFIIYLFIGKNERKTCANLPTSKHFTHVCLCCSSSNMEDVGQLLKQWGLHELDNIFSGEIKFKII